jgi:hypothetical protein
VGKQILFFSLQTANPQFLGLIPQTANSSNFLGIPVRKSQVRKFAWKKAVFPIFYTFARILWTMKCYEIQKLKSTLKFE